MNIKRFKLVCNISSIFLKLAVIYSLAVMVVGIYLMITGKNNFVFVHNGPDLPFFHYGSGSFPDNSEFDLGALIMTPLTIILFSYINWQGSQLFKQLADGDSPFQKAFAFSIRRVSVLLMLADLVSPILYSLTMTIIMRGGTYLILGIGNSFLIGVILYLISEVFYYGIELQDFSDDTV